MSSREKIARREFLKGVASAGAGLAAGLHVGHASAGERAQSPGSAPRVAQTQETLLSDSNWKLGSFAMGEGEHQKVFLPEFDDSSFRTVKVPGEVQLQLGLEGMQLYLQSKELGEVNQKSWWYRKRFLVPKGDSGKLLRLLFEGVDYFATVWLNGEKVGAHEGAYDSFTFDITSKLRFGAENLLAVEVTCPWIPRDRSFAEYLKGDWMMPDPNQMVRLPVPPYTLGPYWGGTPAYGNAAFPMGIWRDVKLLASARATIDDVFVYTTALQSGGKAELKIEGTVTNHTDEQTSGTLRLHIVPDSFQGEPVELPDVSLTLQPGENAFQTQFALENPELWWTWDMGKSNLYKLTATLTEAAGSGADSRQVVFGIRTIERKSDMSYWLNGRRMFLKGAWYPMSDYYGSIPTRQSYERDLELFRAANMNHIVNFTVVEKPDFYDFCDRLGILIFLEFPFSQFGPVDALSPSYPRYEIFVKTALSQIRQIILEHRFHPSIVEWAAFAEAHEKKLGVWGFGEAIFSQEGYNHVSDEIGKLVASLAPGTIYHPSLCDLGEQHFWMANAGMGTGGNYTEHFNANTGFVSEYGSSALPSFETFQKMLTPEQMWSEKNRQLPEWFNLPIDVPAYAYQTTFEYNGLFSILYRVNQCVDRHIQSPQQLVEDSQVYQAFIFKYATEAYRRKKHHDINGVRVWAYVEIAPAIQWEFLDYYRIPKIGYYFLKRAFDRLTLNFAYEEALESQVSGKRLQIPVWVSNDFQDEIPLDVHCEIRDLNGHTLRSQDFSGTVAGDASRQVGLVDWTTPDASGVYVLRGVATARGQDLKTSDSTFIKVTPKLFARPVRLLLIGQKAYSYIPARMAQALGLSVEVMDEESIMQRLPELRNAEELRRKYDVVWLTSFDSLWKLLNDAEADGLKQAIRQGLGFIHTGGPGSFHGGFGRGACLDFTPLAEALPVALHNGNDLVYAQTGAPLSGAPQSSGPIRDIHAVSGKEQEWGEQALNSYGLPGFNDVELKPGSDPVLTISGRPLLVMGQYGQGRTVAFTGFTPEYKERHADWDPTIVSPYVLDQEFFARPVTKAYFDLFMRMVAAASGEKPATSYEDLLAARDKPLFETLKDSPATEITGPARVQGKARGKKATVALELRNGEKYARLVRIKVEWDSPPENTPYLVMFSDNYFDLFQGETRSVNMEVFLPADHLGRISGNLVVEATNARRRQIPLELQSD